MRKTFMSSLLFLSLLLVLPRISSSEDFGISGTWYHNNMQTQINVKDFTHVVLINESGDRAVGRFVGKIF